MSLWQCPSKCLCSLGAPTHWALGELGRDRRAVALFETGTVCMAFCEVLNEQAGLSWSIYPLTKLSQVGVRGVTQKRCCLKTTCCYCRVHHPSTHQGKITWSPPTLYVVTTAYSSASPPLAQVPRHALPCPLQHSANPPHASVSAGALSRAHLGFAVRACSQRVVKGAWCLSTRAERCSAPACRRRGRAPSNAAHSAGGLFRWARWPTAAQGTA